MTANADRPFPESAYAPSGDLWWDLLVRPGAKKARYGGEPRLMAWLAYNKKVGNTFTTAELRAALGDGVPNAQEHLQRRLRILRERDGWQISSVKYDRNLEVGNYRLDRIGWHPGLGTDRPKNLSAVDATTRRKVLERDGSRCVLCGAGSGEPHPINGQPTGLTVGHVKPGLFLGRGDLSNLRTECSLCNEPARAETWRPPGFDQLQAEMRNLKNADLEIVKRWIEAGHRIRTSADKFYDDYRLAAPGDQDRLRASLGRTARRGKIEPDVSN